MRSVAAADRIQPAIRRGLQVARFSLNGTFRGYVLGMQDLHELRAMAILDTKLVVANANKDASKLLLFGACGASGVRPFVRELASSKTDKNLKHP